MQLQQYGTLSDITSIGHHGNLGPLPIITAGELRASGANLGVGAAVDHEGRLLGEVTMVDGQVYMTPYGGKSRPMMDSELLGFTQFASMAPEGSKTLNDITATSPDDVIEQCKAQLTHEAQGAFVMRVKGRFDSMTYRAMTNHDSIYGNFKSFEDMEASCSTHTLENVDFNVSGIFQKDLLPDGLSPEGWHFHGVSADRAAGGHILGFEGFKGTVEIMPIREWHLSLNSAAQTYAKPSPMLTTKQVFHIGEVRAKTSDQSRTTA